GLRKRSNPADASAAAAKVICFMTVIIAAHHQGDKTDYCQAQDLISVSLVISWVARGRMT
ncbi:hypothetical protein, partial [Caldimonas manganoxidans]|uniref:hypothetical protein n=1 Tax=Caldimonas manganoxidans TaxID=196015 RepID=UPI001B7FAFAA